MTKKLNKTELKKEINLFFKEINFKSPKEIKRIKKVAKKINFPLKEKRKLFCNKCFSPKINLKIKIKKGFKRIKCEKCEKISRWKINSS